jgi:hypothetical protein
VKPISFAPVRTAYYPLKGGLDLQTPAIELNPGRCFDCLNYEPVISGGYRRVNGYERFSGLTSPTSADYWTITINLTGAIATSATVTGATSGATGKNLGIYGSTMVLGRVTGTFVSGENLQVTAVTQAVSTSAAIQSGATSASDDADYKLLAANDRRADIAAVPGSGQIRGVEVYNDTVYAFRDNAGGTAGDIYKSTGAGWVKVTLGREIQFTTGSGQIFDGDTVTGASSGASAIARRVLLRTGSWAGTGAGTLVFRTVTGTFTNGENLQVGGVTKAVASGADTAITRSPGGRVETVIANFTGSTATERVYGCDGVNKAFEFDGTDYVPIRTGMTTDTPSHIIEHRAYLILSFLGSMQLSSIGAPYQWTVVTGAAEITTGSAITGFLMQTGSSSGASLMVFTRDKTFVLYGATTLDFSLVPSSRDIGYRSYTMQTVGNSSYGLTARGIHAVVTTLDYGDYDFDAVSFPIASLVATKIGLETASTTLKTKDQYRIFFSDNSAIVVGFSGDKISGLMPLDYGMVVRCITTRTLTDGTEATYFGSDDGYIYKDNTGTSFDGAVITSYIRPAFNNLQSPRMRKRYRRATLEVKAEGFASVNVAYDLGYGNPDVLASRIQGQTMTGAGAYWDQFTWERFNWDTQVFADPTISIEGTEKNIALFFYSSRAQDAPHIVAGIILAYSERRLQR